MPSAKKSRKDAKEAGGVVAAVTKHASGKFISNGNTAGDVSDTSNSSAHSPNFAPSATPSSNGISPMLEPTFTPAIPQSITPAPRAIPGMSDWTSRGGISASLGTSPGNLINLNGESPPSRWSSPRPYGTSHTSHTSQTSHTSHLSHASYGSHNTGSSVSPPGIRDINGMSRQRPVSLHMDSASPYSLSASPHALSGHMGVSPGTRRDSMHSLHSHYAQSRGMASTTATVLPSNPPLPHQPQAHYYGAPEIEIDSQQSQAGMKPGQRGYHFSFDTLPSSHHPNGSSETVVTTGYEGGLEVHSVSKNGLGALASLTGLRGGVYNAKILPWTASSAVAADAYPLVAVVVHGPVLPAAPANAVNVHADAGGPEDTNGTSPGTGPDSYAGAGPEPAHDAKSQTHTSPKVDQRSEFGSGRSAFVGAHPNSIEYYQTTVEVYSLKLNRHVCTLLEAPKIQLKTSVTSIVFQAPPPSGAFHIKADAGNIVISSAVSGECWLYRQMPFSGTGDLPFVFVAKVWTTLQQALKGAGQTQNGEPALDGERTRSASNASSTPPRLGPKQPILSLSGKYLAYCPAAPSSSISLRASVPVTAYGRAPGFSSSAPPHPPSANAELDLPHAESMVNKIMRDATQEFLSGAKWIGQQGMQAFSSYWKGSAGPSTPQTPRSPPSSVGYSPSGRLDAGQFPPTHGSSAPAMALKEPGLVSILDITAVGNSSVVHPVATYSPPLGCSFLSFSPTGLWLFTASSKGDVQTVWDLFRIQYTKSSPLQAYSMPVTPAGHRVRQVAQFSRMTVACIVDVAWAKPNGERLAVVTERGTVHLLDLPSSAYMWPPPRRRTSKASEAGAAGSGAGGGVHDVSLVGSAGGGGRAASNAVSYASSALTTAFDAARPLLARPRRSSANVSQSTGAILADHASHGGKMLAAGISHSLGKTSHAINQLRHTGENRVSLPSGPLAPGAPCAVWVAGKRHHSLFVIGDGLVRNFSSCTRTRSSGQRVLRLRPNRDFRVPRLPEDTLAPTVKHFLDPTEYPDVGELNDAGSNTMILDNRARRQSADKNSILSAVQSAIPHAEIESSAPYQPFHTDRRIALYEYNPQQRQHQQSSAVHDGHAFSPEVDSRPVTANYEPPTSEFSAMTLTSQPPQPPQPAVTPATCVTDEEIPVLRTISKKKKKDKARKTMEPYCSTIPEPVDEALPQHAPELIAATIAAPAPPTPAVSAPRQAMAKPMPKPKNTSWAFGQPIVSTLVDTGFAPMSEEESYNISFEDTRALPASAIERVFQQGEDEHIVVTTRRRRGGNRGGDDEDDEDGFFEDDCEVLDFADQRV